MKNYVHHGPQCIYDWEDLGHPYIIQSTTVLCDMLYISIGACT